MKVTGVRNRVVKTELIKTMLSFEQEKSTNSYQYSDPSSTSVEFNCYNLPNDVSCYWAGRGTISI